MKEHYTTYNQAVKLKDLGFDWKCTAHYSSDGKHLWVQHQGVINSEEFVSPVAPRLDQAQAWLRDKGVHVSVNPYMSFDVDADGELYNEFPLWAFELMDVASTEFMNDAGGKHESYESALSAGIDKALEILTDKTTDK